MALPINLFDTGCVASVTLSEEIDGELVTRTVNDVASINCIPFIVQNVIFWLLVFAGTAALILLIIGGIKFITSGGDPKQTEGARKTLTYAILGLVLILLSFAILRFIAQTTGLNCITKFGFSQCTYTPKGVYGKRGEISCNPDIHRKVCESNRNICHCEDKPAQQRQEQQPPPGGDDTVKSCTTYGAGESECGVGNGQYCNSDLVCVDLPSVGGDYKTCDQMGSTSVDQCPTKQEPLLGPISGICSARPTHKVTDCRVPNTCVCIYQ